MSIGRRPINDIVRYVKGAPHEADCYEPDEPEKVKVNFMDNATKNHMFALIQEVEILKTRIQPHDTGHIHTTINTLERRITEMKESIIVEQ